MTTFTNKAQQQVKEFQEAFNHPVADTPTAIELERATNRSIWTGEEIVEFLHASSTNQDEFTATFDKFLEGLVAAYHKSSKVKFPKNNTERIIAQVDALTDTLYFVYGSFVELGVDSQPVFDIVQGANMSKLFIDENGNKYPKYREDGKILKSEHFYSPEEFIAEEVQSQINKTLTK